MTESAGTFDRSMEFCDFCMELVRLMASPEITGQDYWMPLVEHPGTTCSFCQRLIDELQCQLPDTFEPLNLSPQTLWFHRTISTWRTHTTSYIEVALRAEPRERMYRDTLAIAKYALWVDRGSKDTRFSIRAPILSPGMNNIRNQVQFWLNKCNSDHPHCSIDRVAKLPTRVLSLSEDLHGPKIRLVESKGTGGEYCALSHCWGPIDKRPLRTTTSNLQQHLLDIPYKELPQTFQESVLLVHSLGFQYLWIDSLCILQDDQGDWHSEAKEMRNIYRNASLVIAASGAEDSSQGLFIQSRLHALVTKFPFDVHDETKGYFNAAMMPSSGDRIPCFGVLNTRAWALQERYLARRFLAFMPGGVSWICDSVSLDELDESTDHGFRETKSWQTLLETYTSQKFTYPGDRLEALRGIVAEIQESRKEQFDFRYGVWKDTFHEDILWVPEMRDSSSDVFSLPTWSWAATGGSKSWCRSFCRREILRLPERLETDDSGSMYTKGHLTKALPVGPRVPKQLLNRVQDWWDNPRAYDLEFAFTSYESLASTSKVCFVMGGSNSNILMGLTIFDRGDPTPNAQYLFIASTFRKPCTEEGEKQTDDTSNKPQVNDKDTAVYDVEQYDSEILSCDVDFANTIDWAKFPGGVSAVEKRMVRQYDYLLGKTGYVYLCLMLEPASEGKYKRIGIAMLYPHAMKGLDATVEEIEVI